MKAPPPRRRAPPGASVPWIVAGSWFALAVPGLHPSIEGIHFEVLAVAMCLLIAAARLPSAIVGRVRFLVLVVGLALAYSCVRDVVWSLPIGVSRTLSVSPARWSLLAGPIAALASRRRQPIHRDLGRGLVAGCVVLGLLIVVGASTYALVGADSGDRMGAVLGPITAGAAETMMLFVLADCITGTLPGAQPASAEPPAARVAPGTFLRTASLLAILFAVPFSMQIDLEQASGASHLARMPVVDPLIWAAAAIELLSIVRSCAANENRRGIAGCFGREIAAGVDPRLVLIPIAGAASLLASGAPFRGGKELLQMFDTYVVFGWLLARYARRFTYRGLAFGLSALYVLVIAANLRQVWVGTPSFLLRAVFPEHQSLVAATILLAPLVWCSLQERPERWLRTGASLLAGVGSVLSGTLVAPFLIFGQLAIAGMLTRRRLSQSGLILAAAALTLMVLPARYRESLLAEPQTWIRAPFAERRAQVMEAKALLPENIPQWHVPVGFGYLFAYLSASEWTRTPPTSIVPAGSDPRQSVYPECYAESWSALRLVGAHPILGTGIGTWGTEIGTGYGMLERTGTSFPNSQNGYLLLGVTLGMLGLTVWIHALARSLQDAVATARKGGRESGWMATGSIASLLGASVIMLVCPIATLPLGVYWVLAARVGSSPNGMAAP